MFAPVLIVREDFSLEKDVMPDRSSEIAGILREVYPSAKSAVYQLEVYQGKRNRKIVRRLTQLMDGLSVALQPDADDMLAARHIREAHGFLADLSVFPLEWLSMRKLEQLRRFRRRKWLFRLLWVATPDFMATDFDGELRRIAKCIQAGQTAVDRKDKTKQMEEALRLGDSLFRCLRPQVYHERLYSIFLLVVGLLVGRVLGFIL